MQRYNHPPLFGAPPPKGQQGPKPTFHKIPSQHYNVTVAGWSKQIESQWRSCVQIGLYVYGSNCLFSFMKMRDDLYCTVRVQYVLVLVHRPIHRRTVHRGLGARDPSFFKICRRAPQSKNFFHRTLMGLLYEYLENWHEFCSNGHICKRNSICIIVNFVVFILFKLNL